MTISDDTRPVSPLGLVIGTQTLIVGLAYGASAGLRVYVGHRARGRCFILYGVDAERMRRAWTATYTGDLLIDLADLPDLFTDPPGRHAELLNLR